MALDRFVFTSAGWEFGRFMSRIHAEDGEKLSCVLEAYYVQHTIQNGHLHFWDLAVFLAPEAVSRRSNSLIARSFASLTTEGFLSLRAVATTVFRDPPCKESPISIAMGSKVACSLWKDEGWHFCLYKVKHLWMSVHVVDCKCYEHNRRRGSYPTA